MNKQNLVREIASRIEGASQKDVALILDTFQEVVRDTVIAGDDVKMTGFLTFSKKHVPAKSGIVQLGDKKGQTWKTPAKDEIAVKISKSYKTI
jgi:nucleoid DNA-binding protein